MAWGGERQCVGDPGAFHFAHAPKQACAAPPVALMVLTQNPTDPKTTADWQVPLCAPHQQQARQADAEWMEDEPRAWQCFLFPRQSQTERRYADKPFPAADGTQNSPH